MADEQYRWLDREAAERLLRGEPLAPAVDATVRDRAGRLAETLGALSTAPAAPDSTELPGEAAAMAAFRAARGAERPAVGRRARTAASGSADAGLVRLGRPAPAAGRFRWGRPVRLGLSAALAAGMVGGVAVAAGTGVLPAPFGGVEPGPAASVSAAASP
ncbi:extensin, partial [Streptomyces adustus]|nr:extensin [Streptomyces adustus]